MGVGQAGGRCYHVLPGGYIHSLSLVFVSRLQGLMPRLHLRRPTSTCHRPPPPPPMGTTTGSVLECLD